MHSCFSWDFLSPGRSAEPAAWTVPSAACSLNGHRGPSAHTPVETRVRILKHCYNLVYVTQLVLKMNETGSNHF